MFTESDNDTTTKLVRQLYEALAAVDLPALDRLLDPDFRGVLAAGLPFGIGGEHKGAYVMRDRAWGAIAGHFIVEVEAERFLPLVDGRMLVTGRYAGHGRRDGGPLDAPFAHIITTRNGRICGLEQYTDNALWQQAAPTTSG